MPKSSICYPMAKIYSESRRIQKYLLFDAVSHEFKLKSPQEIVQQTYNGEDIRGFTGQTTSGIKVDTYFIQVDDIENIKEKAVWLVYKRNINGRKTTYTCINIQNEEIEITREELEKLASTEGTIVYGMKMSKGHWVVQPEVQIQINNSPLM